MYSQHHPSRDPRPNDYSYQAYMWRERLEAPRARAAPEQNPEEPPRVVAFSGILVPAPWRCSECDPPQQQQWLHLGSAASPEKPSADPKSAKTADYCRNILLKGAQGVEEDPSDAAASETSGQYDDDDLEMGIGASLQPHRAEEPWKSLQEREEEEFQEALRASLADTSGAPKVWGEMEEAGPSSAGVEKRKEPGEGEKKGGAEKRAKTRKGKEKAED
ncbi:MAG: hypothetical protein M1821_007869 [Bathelium mastoideum]|nr:MAG: hypothetical protein M1821_007869 [Bathelium mastoideum]